MATTTFGFEGFEVVRYLGIARGITVRSRSVFGAMAAGIQMLFGGQIVMFTMLCEKAREEAFEVMMAHAHRMGANAVIGMRYDATELASGVAEVICYGTAVVVEPLEGGH